MTNVAVGGRVTSTGFLNTLGAYSTERLIAAASLIKLPGSIGFDTAAAMTMCDLTSAYLMRRIQLVAGDATRQRTGTPWFGIPPHWGLSKSQEGLENGF